MNYGIEVNYERRIGMMKKLMEATLVYIFMRFTK